MAKHYKLESKTYQLTADFAAKGFLHVPMGATAVLDLNGKTLSRARDSKDKDGHVIEAHNGGVYVRP